ncbi:MAG: hypothetical protein V1770_04670 [bacterium]
MALNKQTIAIIILLVGISFCVIQYFLMANVNWKGTEQTKKVRNYSGAFNPLR